MWRYWAGGGALLAAAGAGVLLTRGIAHTTPLLPSAPQATAAPVDATAADDAVPEATPATREQKRFNRYDKDRNNAVSRDEYLAARRKAFAKLDANGDGRLDFDEWAVKALSKFGTADKDRSGAMTPEEFATTAVTRKARPRAKCPPAQSQPVEES